MTTSNTARQTNRSMWIDQRTAELMAAGWKQQKLAAKRAAREWRNQTPQHKAAVRRNNSMSAARTQRMLETSMGTGGGSNHAAMTLIEAKQFTSGAGREIALFAGVNKLIGYVEDAADDEIVTLQTAHGPEVARLGDYVVKGATGSVCVIQRATFEAVFAPAIAPSGGHRMPMAHA